MFELLVPTGKCPSFSCHLDTVQSYLKNWKIAQIRLACGNICDKLLWLVTDAGGPSHCGSAILSKVILDCRQILDEHKPDGTLANSIPPWLCFCFSSCLGFSHWWTWKCRLKSTLWAWAAFGQESKLAEWCCSRNLWNHWKLGPCWRKYINVSRICSFIAWPYFLFHLSTSCVLMNMWSINFLLLLLCFPCPGRRPSWNCQSRNLVP